MSDKKYLYRSQNNKMVSGVCAGMAEYFDIDPTLVRIGIVLLVFLTGGSFGLALPLLYLAMAIIVPEAPVDELRAAPDNTLAIPAASAEVEEYSATETE